MIHDELKSKCADALYRFIQSFYDYFFNKKYDVLRYKRSIHLCLDFSALRMACQLWIQHGLTRLLH